MGRKLLFIALHDIRAAGFTRVLLNYFESNVRIAGVYNQLGFVACGGAFKLPRDVATLPLENVEAIDRAIMTLQEQLNLSDPPTQSHISDE